MDIGTILLILLVMEIVTGGPVTAVTAGAAVGVAREGAKQAKASYAKRAKRLNKSGRFGRWRARQEARVFGLMAGVARGVRYGAPKGVRAGWGVRRRAIQACKTKVRDVREIKDPAESWSAVGPFLPGRILDALGVGAASVEDGDGCVGCGRHSAWVDTTCGETLCRLCARGKSRRGHLRPITPADTGSEPADAQEQDASDTPQSQTPDTQAPANSGVTAADASSASATNRKETTVPTALVGEVTGAASYIAAWEGFLGWAEAAEGDIAQVINQLSAAVEQGAKFDPGGGMDAIGALTVLVATMNTVRDTIAAYVAEVHAEHDAAVEATLAARSAAGQEYHGHS